MSNQDLREMAINAIANYMHHKLYDAGMTVNMLPFLRTSAEDLLTGCDRACEATIKMGKEKGLVA